MNLITTFDPPPPLMFWRMSYYDKTRMRLDSSLLQNERQVTKSSSENSGVASQSATVPSMKSSKDGNISVFEGGIVYEKSTASHSRRTPDDETKEFELPSHGARGPGKLLSKFIDDRSRPEEANARKRDIDSVKSTSTPHLPISNTKLKMAVKRTDTTKDTVNTSSSGTDVRHNLEKDNTKSNNESKKRNTTAMKNTDITTSKEGPKQKVAKINLTEPKPLETNWLSDMQGIAQVAQPAQSLFQKADFAGIERFCRNAGSTKEGLASFIKKASSSDNFAVSLMWSSQFAPVSLSSNHSTCSVKYCTPSVACYKWYCSCDRHIRVQQAFEPLLGALILFPDEQQHLYFLPLSKCNHPTSSDATQTDNSPSESKNSIPLNCKTTLKERWEAFLKVVLHKQSQKIIYNFQLTLLPLFAACYGLRDDIQIDGHFVGELTVIENVFDPRIAAYICETDTQESGFEFLALCSRFEISLSPISGSGGNLGLVAVAVGQCHGELKALLQLKSHLQVDIEKREGSMKVLKMLEMPLVALLSLMELRGVEMSQQILKGINEKIDLKLASIIEEAHQLVGPFNLASPEQVANILYTKLKLPTTHTSAKGRHSSTSEEDLLKIRTLHPVVNMILSFRSLSKISTTYISGLRPFILRREKKLVPQGIQSTQSDLSKNTNNNFFDSGADRIKSKNSIEVCSRVHANWNQTTVRTGRLSCCRPNLQNIPNEQTVGGLDIVVRTAFKASQGCILVAADYSQIEMRVMAQLCRDPNMMSLFQGSGDIYRGMAAQILGKSSLNDVTLEERNKAKVICLGTIYGMGPALAASKLGIDVAAANRITNAFFNKYKDMKLWMMKIKNEARKNGYVKTILGRRRYLPDISSSDPSKRAQAERQAVNSVVQGSASDIIKLAMVGVEVALVKLPHDVRVARMGNPQLIMQIHDELIYEVTAQPSHCNKNHSDDFRYQDGSSSSSSNSSSGGGEGQISEFQDLLQRCMGIEVMKALGFSVPLTITIKTGPDWGNLVAKSLK